MSDFDVVVIGGGPGGYIAAIRSAQLGKKVALIDAAVNAKGGPALGGTCTNVGCIPSKALLQSSEHYEHASLHFADHGISVKGISMNVEKMIQRKEQIIQQNNDGIQFLFKKNKVTFYHGTAALQAQKDGKWMVAVTAADKKGTNETLSAQHVILATGSAPRALPQIAFDEKQILSNTGALALSAAPKRLGVIGSGVIGLEMGSVWRRLGSQVTILEAMPKFLAAADEQVAKEAQKLFAKQGLGIELGVQIESVKKTSKAVTVVYKEANGTQKTVEFDKLIVSIGRIPFTEQLGLDAVGVQTDDRGFIVVDDYCKTSQPNIWAIGDVVRGPMLAHKAEEEGVAVAERINGEHGHVNFHTIPWVIYTSPEIAWVGKTEQALKAEGIAYKSGSFPFLANGRARALGDTSGFVKFLADAKTDEILGVHIIGPVASELIAECVVAMEFRAAAEDIARICHAHPSLSESVKEAALAVDKRSLNF